MLNHEPLHPYFDELCALAASGQISEPEFVELQDHLKECEECRSAYSDFTDLLHYKLPLAHPELTGVSKPGGFFLGIPPIANAFSRKRANRALRFPACLCGILSSESWQFGCCPHWTTQSLLRSQLWYCSW